MSETIDASSKYQDSLPISSDAIMALLDEWDIPYTRADHVPLRTVEDFKKSPRHVFAQRRGWGTYQKPVFARPQEAQLFGSG